MRRKASVWRRTPIKKHKSVVKPLQPSSDKKPKLSQEAVLKNCISQTSQLSMHIQQLLDECFVLAPNQLRGYLLRADVEVRDLLRLLTSKIGSTPDPDVLPVDYFKEDLKDVDEKHVGTVNTAVSGANDADNTDDTDLILVEHGQTHQHRHKKKKLGKEDAAKARAVDMISLSTSALLEELAESSEADSFESEIKTLTNVSRRYVGLASMQDTCNEDTEDE